MKKRALIADLFLQRRLFLALATLGLMYVVSFHVPFLMSLATMLLLLLALLFCLEYILLFFTAGKMYTQRQVEEVLSLADENKVMIELQSTYNFPVTAEVIDELPVQFQMRRFHLKSQLQANE